LKAPFLFVCSAGANKNTLIALHVAVICNGMLSFQSCVGADDNPGWDAAVASYKRAMLYAGQVPCVIYSTGKFIALYVYAYGGVQRAAGRPARQEQVHAMRVAVVGPATATALRVEFTGHAASRPAPRPRLPQRRVGEDGTQITAAAVGRRPAPSRVATTILPRGRPQAQRPDTLLDVLTKARPWTSIAIVVPGEMLQEIQQEGREDVRYGVTPRLPKATFTGDRIVTPAGTTASFALGPAERLDIPPVVGMSRLLAWVKTGDASAPGGNRIQSIRSCPAAVAARALHVLTRCVGSLRLAPPLAQCVGSLRLVA
jgi:hypothetical protein